MYRCCIGSRWRNLWWNLLIILTEIKQRRHRIIFWNIAEWGGSRRSYELNCRGRLEIRYGGCQLQHQQKKLWYVSFHIRNTKKTEDLKKSAVCSALIDHVLCKSGTVVAVCRIMQTMMSCWMMSGIYI
jgi:hypothetical protein